YRKEVEAGVNVTPAEITAGMRRYPIQLRVVIFRLSSEESARMLARALGRPGKEIDSISSAGYERRIVSHDTVTVSFGIADVSLEAAAYALDSVHRVSPAFPSPMLGWAVVLLLDSAPNPACSAQSIPERMMTVKNTVRRRKAESRGLRYMASVLDPRRAEADRGAIGILGKALLEIIMADTAAHRAGGRFIVTPGEIDRLEQMLKGDLSRVLVEMEGGGITLGEAIQSFRLEPFTTPSLRGRTFAYVLNESVKRIAREEILAREGYRKNLQASPSVRHDIETWRDNWLAHEMEAEITRGAPAPTEEEEIGGLIENARLLSPSYEVNVREIFTDSLPKAARYREMVSAGEDMGSLARRVSMRRGWAERGGVSEYFHVGSFPELGVRALLADSGQLVGPVGVAGGYSLFRVLGKHLPRGDSAVTVDSLRRALHEYIRSDIRRRSLDRFIAALAGKFGVEMYADRVKTLTLFSHSMFTRRYIGFGGMMNAAPVLQPDWEWVREYVRSQAQVP
ncbi:MAG TPA: peptidylprolyl isomerase, partial [Bacteroidota bacterium]|nr:peptidylprolyl isomerase [Bacteroidota bacterium]